MLPLFLPQAALVAPAAGAVLTGARKIEASSTRLQLGRKAQAMRRRSPLVQAAVAGAALALALPLTVRAENTAERASRMLNFEARRDRAQDHALGARAADRARSTPALATSPGAREIDEDRAAVGPDVGRPEEFGRTPRSLRDTGYNFNLTR